MPIKFTVNNLSNNIYLKSNIQCIIEIRVQCTIHKMGCKLKQCDKYK